MSRKNDLELRIERYRNKIAHLSPDQQYTLHFGSDVAENLLRSNEHYVPSESIKKDVKFYGGGKLKKIMLRTRSSSRVVYRQAGTGKLITARETTSEREETVQLPLDEYQSSPSTVSSPKPPLNAEYVLHLFLKRDERDAVIGDLLERYAGKCERFGERRAKLWFYSEVARSLRPLLKRLIAKVSGLIALGEWIRRHVS